VDTRAAKRLILPATLAVATFVSANSCKRYEEYCPDIENMADCDAEDGCGWSEALDECVNTCSEIQTQADCEAVDRCEWSESINEGDTGASESCHEPFT
jgi:uncharacterized protein YgiB involved in biofilm formation